MLRAGFLFSCLCFLLSPSLQGQTWHRYDSIAFFENAARYKSPYAGGLDLPQFSTFRLDADTIPDLIIYDRDGDLVIPFLNDGASPTAAYTFAPQYAAAFPLSGSWMLARDYNCDGKEDLFLGYQNGISVYRNTGTAGNPAFTLAVQKLQADLNGTLSDIFVLNSDIPCIRDADNDGDLDILSFDAGGTFVYFYRNNALPSGSCDSLNFTLAESCWGKFIEAGFTNAVTLNASCKGITPPSSGLQHNLHAGSTLEGFDENGDHDLELLAGDLIASNLVYLRNGGSVTTAFMDTSDFAFPWYDSPVNLDQFVASFVLDAGNDGKTDILVAPNAGGVSANYRNVWYYKDIGTAGRKEFSRSSLTFLQSDMVDAGSTSRPAFFDENRDGLPDLIIGNRAFKTPTQNFSGLTLFRNTGTLSQPAFSLITRDYQNISSLFTPSIFSMAPAFGDLDGDGDDDLIIGDYNGKVHLLTNNGGTGGPANFALTAVDYSGIDVGQYATPVLFDLDGDQLLDLVIGEMGGTLNYFRNTGTAAVPAFSATPTSDTLGGIDVNPVCCTGYSAPCFFRDPATQSLRMMTGTETGELLLYGNIDGNVTGTWTLLDGNYLNLNEGNRLAPIALNLDSDAEIEYVFGNIRGGISIWDLDTTVSAQKPVRTSLGFHIVPNPSARPLVICDKELPGGFHISVFNANGQVVLKEHALSRYHELGANELPEGLYWIRIADDAGNTGTQKWVKVKP